MIPEGLRRPIRKLILSTDVRKTLCAQIRRRKASLGVRGVRQLVSASNDTELSKSMRSEAVDLIGLLALVGRLRKKQITEVVPTLTRIVAKEHRVLAWSAAVSLGYMDEPYSVSKLIRAARKGIQRENRRAAIYALGALGDPRPVDLLVLVLRNRHEHPDLRAEAAQALASCGRGSPDAIEALSTALHDPSAEVRFSSATALRTIRGGRL